MAEASRTATMKVGAESLMRAIRDYENYPSFVQGVSSARVIDKGGQGLPTRVSYAIEVMGKAISYTLDHEEVDGGLRWTLVESNLMKANEGSWVLKALGPDATEVTYAVKLDLNFSVPGFIMKSLVASSLPSLMAAFEKRAVG